jgi:diguanylate cyclase (GGDEF)-like protein
MRWTRWRRAKWYALAGAMLSVAAPTGLLVLREVATPRPIATELLSDRLTYLYVLVATAVVLAFVGYALGRQADRLAALSETDSLTGLPNRRALRRHLDDEYHRSLRYGTPVSMLLIDVDGLKQVNDAGGHAAGDRLLRDIAATIVAALRHSDFAARWGGDEFAVLALNTPADAALRSAERLVARVRSHVRGDRGRPATVSVGVATFDPEHGPHTGLDELMQAADAALYRAKASGRDCAQAA